MPANKVLIRKLPDLDRMDGVEVGDHENTSHRIFNNMGIVEYVCSSLFFTRDMIMHLKSTGASLRVIQDMSRESCMFLTHIEVKPGDIVLYRRVNNVIEEEIVDMERIVIPHDDLIARVNPDQTLYPLAGNVIIKDTQIAVTEVVAEGLPVIEYFDHFGYKDFGTPIQGKTVVINHRQAAPVADESLSIFGHLAYIKRRHILLVVD